MLWNREHGLRLVEAVAGAAIPTFVGFTVFNADGTLSLFDARQEQSMKLEDSTGSSENAWLLPAAVEECVAANPHVVGFNVMHTKMEAMAPALQEVRKAWAGPLGCYPDFGVWERTGWATPQPLDGAQLAREASKWSDEAGASLFGGCCGVGAEHIAALRNWADRS
jgi:methionine synthase I (cobalamin-dependent)